MAEDILKQAFEKAKGVINSCITPNGLYASGGIDGYNAVWARDSMISMIGASVVNDEKYKEVFKNSIKTLAENQGRTGQIPNCVDKWEDRKPHVDFKSIDSSLWFLIGNHIYKERYNDDSLMKKYKINIDKTLNWLNCQDFGENYLLGQLPTSDWQDAFPHRYGYTINTQALYHKVLTLKFDNENAIKLKNIVNNDEDDGLWNGNFYVPYRWKNHRKYKEIGDWFDSLGNFLSIVFELADESHSEKILSYVKKHKINVPYPVRTIYPPITKKHKDWQDYYLDCGAGTPNHYSNGGIWGYIGGFYILSLIKYKRYDEAKKALTLLAERDLQGNFPEWTDPIKKKHYGSMQAWEAGMYILAYESLDEEKVLL
jgi:glycogen debranching enzyme